MDQRQGIRPVLWRRASNESTNGLLRQYVRKRTDLKANIPADLDVIAAELNERPRQTLQFMASSEKFTEAVDP